MTRFLRRLLKKLGAQIVRDSVVLFFGWLRFRKSGVTPQSAHHALVLLFCQTGGTSNDLLHRFIARRRPPREIDAQGVLGNVGAPQLDAIANALRDRGYYVFEQRLPAALCDRLLEFALAEKAAVKIGGQPALEQYDRRNPRGVRYDFSEEAILRNEAAQQLMADRSVLAVAQAYLGCLPILDLIACWWHTSWSQQPDKDAAQFFHFDMDRIKWLKFFFYATDVGTDNGPHTFVARSHRTHGIPSSILQKGQVRIDDEEVLRSYEPADLIEFCGPRGTIIAEDTRGLHKGKHVRAGDRLVFQLEFSDSLFGADYPDPKFGYVPGPVLKEMAAVYPGVYSRFVPAGGS
jgi:hypothetical protein